MLSEYDGNGGLNYNYIYGNGKKLARKDGSGIVNYLHSDYLGSLRVITNSSGTAIWNRNFRSPGKIGTEIRQLPDDPEIGRFTQADPLWMKYPSLTSYQYCDNNPLRFIDPNGTEWYYYQADGDEEAKWHYHEDTKQMEIWNGQYDNDENKVMQMTQGIVELLSFNGNQFSWYLENGEILNWDAVSGIIDKNGNSIPELQGIKGGPIPEDWYLVDPSQTLGISNAAGVYDYAKWILKYSAWGGYNTPILAEDGSQNYAYNRNNAFIHGGWFAGSAGCIDLTGNNDCFHKVFLEHGRKLRLNVNYSLPRRKQW